jgi:LacI family transcriptional regulator
MGERVTIEEIAREAGVSAATVSRALNNPEKVQSKTRDAVYEAMRNLDYVPPTSHREPENLSRIIGFFSPNLFLDSFTETLHAVERELGPTSFDLLLANMRGERDFEGFVSRNVHLCRKIDGAIVFSANVSEKAVEFMAGLGIPVALLQARSSRVRSVSNNNFLGGRDATDYLLSCGYRNVSFIGWEPRDDHISDRLDGYRSALTRRGLPFRDELIQNDSLDNRGGYRATEEVFSRARPDAVFYASDVLALGGLQKLRELGLSVPGDVGVMGFDDLSIAETLGLTTMRQFFAEKARMAVDYLLRRIHGEIPEDMPEELQMTPRLIVRDTTRCHTETPPSEEWGEE